MSATQLALLIDPAPVRHSDPETSRLAAAAHSHPTPGSDLHRDILAALRVRPRADEELCDLWPERCAGTVIKRRTELLQAGLVTHDGLSFRTSRHGRSQRVWQAS